MPDAQPNLFSSLATFTVAREDFTSTALGWLLRREPEALAAFVEACAASFALDRNRDGAGSTILRRLATTRTLRIETHRWLGAGRGHGRHCCPDLALIDTTSRSCCLVEIKIAAATTYHRAGARWSHEAADAEEVRYDPQTKRYRRWLRSEYPGRGLLFALTAKTPDRDLTAHCDGAFTWTDFAQRLRSRTTVRASRMTEEFIAFLEECSMATPAFPALTADDNAALCTATPISWEKWGSLLDSIARRLAAKVETHHRGWTAKVQDEGCFQLWRRPRTSTLLACAGYVVAGTPPNRFWLTPVISCDGSVTGFSLDVWFRGWDLARLQEILDVPVQGDPDGLYCTIPTPPRLLAKASLDDQADALATAAMQKVVAPVLAARVSRK